MEGRDMDYMPEPEAEVISSDDPRFKTGTEVYDSMEGVIVALHITVEDARRLILKEGDHMDLIGRQPGETEDIKVRIHVG